MSAGTAIELRDLSKSFHVRRARGRGLSGRVLDALVPQRESILAIDRLSFSIPRGQRLAFIGPNGAGKSTTLKILSGILQPDSGEVRVLGLIPARQRRALGFQIGTVFGQRSQLWYQLPARDTFALLGRVYEMDPAEHRRRLDVLTALFDLAPLVDTPVRQLSLGQRMRCEIAASLLHAPRVLFLDEPTIGLDVSAKAVIRELLRAQSARDGVTLLLTSHDTGDIERVCERVIVINGGRLLWDGAVGDLRRAFLSVKRVTIWTDKERLDVELPGVRLVASEPFRTDLEVNATVTSLGQVVDAVLRQGAIRDLEVEETPLDVVIRALYASAGEQG